jgi:hypothetical protein
MNTAHLRRKVNHIESETGIDSTELDELTVVEALSYEIKPVAEDIVRVVETGELRRCCNPTDIAGWLMGEYHA